MKLRAAAEPGRADGSRTAPKAKLGPPGTAVSPAQP